MPPVALRAIDCPGSFCLPAEYAHPSGKGRSLVEATQPLLRQDLAHLRGLLDAMPRGPGKLVVHQQLGAAAENACPDQLADESVVSWWKPKRGAAAAPSRQGPPPLSGSADRML